jgi:hypothetical protein
VHIISCWIDEVELNIDILFVVTHKKIFLVQNEDIKGLKILSCLALPFMLIFFCPDDDQLAKRRARLRERSATVSSSVSEHDSQESPSSSSEISSSNCMDDFPYTDSCHMPEFYLSHQMSVSPHSIPTIKVCPFAFLFVSLVIE